MNAQQRNLKNLQDCINATKHVPSLDLGLLYRDHIIPAAGVKDAVDKCYRAHGHVEMENMLSALEANLKIINLRHDKMFYTPVGDVKVLTQASVDDHSVVYSYFRILYTSIHMTHEMLSASKAVSIDFLRQLDFSKMFSTEHPQNYYPYLVLEHTGFEPSERTLKLAKTFYDNPLIANGKRLDLVARAALIEAISDLKNGFKGQGGPKNPKILLPTDSEALYLIRMARHYHAMLAGAFCRQQVTEHFKQIEGIANMHAFIKLGVSALGLVIGNISTAADKAVVKTGVQAVVTRGIEAENDKTKNEHNKTINSMQFQSFRRYLDESRAKLNAAMNSGNFTDDTKLQVCKDTADDLYGETEAWYRSTKFALEQVEHMTKENEKRDQEIRELRQTGQERDQQIREMQQKQNVLNEQFKKILEREGVKLNNIIRDSHARFYASFSATSTKEKYTALAHRPPKLSNLTSRQTQDMAGLWAVLGGA